MRTGLSLATLAFVLAIGASGAHAGIIPYTITLTGTPGGAGTFNWDDGGTAISNFTLNLGAFGPFAGGPNDGAPVSFGSGTFNGTSFLTQISVLYAPYFDVRINTDGTWVDTNGRIGGTYSTASAAQVPEPGTLALLGAGLLGLGFLRRKRAA